MVSRSRFLFVFSCGDRTLSLAPVSCSCFPVENAHSRSLLVSGGDDTWSLAPISCSCFSVGTTHGRSLPFLVCVFRWGPHMVTCSHLLAHVFWWEPHMVAHSRFLFVFSGGDCTWSLSLISYSCFLLGTTHGHSLPFQFRFSSGDRTWLSCGDRTWSLTLVFLFVFFMGTAHGRSLSFHVPVFGWAPLMVTHSHFQFLFSGGDHTWSLAPVSCSCFPVGIAHGCSLSFHVPIICSLVHSVARSCSYSCFQWGPDMVATVVLVLGFRRGLPMVALGLLSNEEYSLPFTQAKSKSQKVALIS